MSLAVIDLDSEPMAIAATELLKAYASAQNATTQPSC
jgi:hypothetical protein